MKAIILAAGEGKRLRPFTESKPKCLVELEGKSILDWQIEVMQACGIDDIIVVKGYKADRITRQDVRYYINEDYNITNMVMTLWCAEPEFKGEIIVAYGDIIYNKEVLQALVEAGHDISVVVDTDWERYWKLRFADPLSDAEAFKMDEHGRIKVIGQKPAKIADVEAGYIGLIKFRERGLEVFKKSFLNAQKVSELRKNPWGAPRSIEKAYMTDMLQGLINEGQDVYATRIHGGWLEIDSMNDYGIANKIFSEGKVKLLS